ncbi:HlyD family secretion protein [Aureliella helgolandensis]|uniref:Multidrug export protein EmrA n=1 Tax=Aureliella helgolandensis TaxID=2527968 RepID=A0A518G6M8_9BACT|nr:HlyD family secretion protein [Aureliella helgolandensis]QDV24224.1 Multidrug export protein EmrA [Aureliella helgolandensis]
MATLEAAPVADHLDGTLKSSDAAAAAANPAESGGVSPHISTGNAELPAKSASRFSALLARTGIALTLLVATSGAGYWYFQSWHYVSTDDAYINGHATLVASRVSGQAAEVLVEDNNRVRKGDVVVRLDKQPFLVQLRIAEAIVLAAEAELAAAMSEVRGFAAEARTMRFALEHAIEDVENQVALLRSKIAVLHSREANLSRAQSDYKRVNGLVGSGAVTQQELDESKESLLVAEAEVEGALQDVYQVRIGLGIPERPSEGEDLSTVPENLSQNFSSVLEAQAALIRAASRLNAVDSYTKSPSQMLADFDNLAVDGNIDRVLAKLISNAPTVKTAEARLELARRRLAEAQLELEYTDVVAEIDGVVTRRNVNPGNNVAIGQSLMAIRSLNEVWVDANFKETQLPKLRIGQPVHLAVDMYGSRETFQGRISGFTMGTGSTLALLPAQNATGNFVKVVQRLPVRIELVDYDPDKSPLFIGLSVEPRVMIKQPPMGPNAGMVLQPHSFIGNARDKGPVRP